MIYRPEEKSSPPELGLVRGGIAALESAFDSARTHLRRKVFREGKFDGNLGYAHQQSLHGLAYLGCELEGSRRILDYAEAVAKRKGRGELEFLIAASFVAGCLRRWAFCAEISSLEKVPASEMGIDSEVVHKVLRTKAAKELIDKAGGTGTLGAIAEMVADREDFGDMGIEDETMRDIQAQFLKFSNNEVVPIAEQVHRRDELIAMDLINKLAEQGVFGITIPEEFGGLDLGKMGMVIVTEELSRGYIGVGSLGTRSEIAGELILIGGTREQKEEWLPKIASGEVLPTALFTEPNYGSDLAGIKTSALKTSGGGWVLSGQKTWVTHGGRADLCTFLARTDPEKSGYRGLSMFLVPKTRGDAADPFPDEGISGTEIPVIGYRGMKEYEISFDGYEVGSEALLGNEEGKGFKQLMATFESARIQTAARGVGLARAALELSFRYAFERHQFGGPIFRFPRVHQKIAKIVVDTQVCRQLTYFAAGMKESGKRCDLEAGMAKLLATRTAFLAADAGVQIHGGNGYAEEYSISRVFLDSRVLSIFEGANEIQAHVVARRLLEQA